jgi:hypothetical protein
MSDDVPTEGEISRAIFENLASGKLKRVGDGYALTPEGEADAENSLLMNSESLDIMMKLARHDLNLGPSREAKFDALCERVRKQLEFKDKLIEQLLRETGRME